MTTRFRAPSLASACMMASAAVSAAAVPGKLTTDWVGNTFGFSEMIHPDGAPTDDMNRMWVQDYVDNLWVSQDGKVFAYSDWDEGSRCTGIYQNGKVLGQTAFGKNYFGNNGDIVGDNKYVYTTSAVNRGNWVTNGFGIERFTYDGAAAGWSTGAGFLSSYFVERDSGGNPSIARLAIDTNAHELYLLDTIQGGTVFVFDLSTLSPSPKTSWALQGVGAMVSDQNGSLWVIRDRQIQKISNRGVSRSIAINSLAAPTRLSIDKNGRLLAFDDSTLQVHIFGGLSGSPTETGTFGTAGGIYTGVKGQVAPNKLLPKCAGIGSDSSGNLYIAWGGVNPVAGSDIRSYSPAGQMNWQLLGHTFGACGGFDPSTDGKKIYYRDHQYAIDYTKPSGQKWTYQSFLWDRATDTPTVSGGSVLVRQLGGKTILFTTASGMMSGGFLIKKLNGQVATPAGNISNGSWAWWVEPDGNIWNVNGSKNVTRYLFTGLDATGSPVYNTANPTTFPAPKEVSNIQRMHYDSTSDALYLSGYDAANPGPSGEWGRTGTVFTRYDGWVRGSKTLAWKIVLPLDNPQTNIPGATLKDMWVEGDYAFFVTCNSTPIETIYVYSLADGSSVGTILPGPEIAGDIQFTGVYGALGWVDMAWGIQAYKRSTGEYEILVEDDVHAKNVFYHWCPSGSCPEPTTSVVPHTRVVGESVRFDSRTGRIVLPGGKSVDGRR